MQEGRERVLRPKVRGCPIGCAGSLTESEEVFSDFCNCEPNEQVAPTLRESLNYCAGRAGSHTELTIVTASVLISSIVLHLVAHSGVNVGRYDAINALHTIVLATINLSKLLESVNTFCHSSKWIKS